MRIRIIPDHGWKNWFAWYPVLVTTQNQYNEDVVHWVWLETVYRRNDKYKLRSL